MSIYLFERDLLTWIPRYKYLRASGVTVHARACKSGFIYNDSSGAMGAHNWTHDSPVVDPGFGQGGPSSGPPNLADIAEQSLASEASISRHGVWGPA